MDGNDTARKIAFCGALVAGIAYFGVTILKDAFTRPSKSKLKRRNSDVTDSINHVEDNTKLSHASSQTDLTLPIGTREKFTAFRTVPPELWAPWARGIQERIRDLNLRMVNSAGFMYNKNMPKNQLPLIKSTLSLQNSPRHSPRARSPDSSSSVKSFNSYSTENLNDANTSHYNKTKSNSRIGLAKVMDMTVPSETEVMIHKRRLDKMFGNPNPNISQQESSSLTMLLLVKDEDILVKTLSVLANCAAFTINIDPICDSGCVLLLSDLLVHDDVAVQVAATQAIANIALGERAQELLKDCIPVLIDQLKTCTSELQLNWTLTALANLALKDANQHEMARAIDKLYDLLSNSTPLLRLQAIKLLINLSCNSYMVPYLLAAKSPSNFFTLLTPTQDGELLLRFCHFLANVIEVTSRRDIKPKDLPGEYKAASPETLYSAIYGFETSELLIKRLTYLGEKINDNDTLVQIKRILKKVR